MHTPLSMRWIGIALLVSITLIGCSKRERYTYWYDNGEVWLVSESGAGQRAMNGLRGGVRMVFDIPASCSDPESWRPTREVVLAELIKQDQAEGFIQPKNYRREGYWTNFVSHREFRQRRGK